MLPKKRLYAFEPNVFVEVIFHSDVMTQLGKHIDPGDGYIRDRSVGNMQIGVNLYFHVTHLYYKNQVGSSKMF
jgi:hypothetical protein